MVDPSSELTASSGILTGLAAVMALVLANAFFVAAEFALVGARRTRLEELAQSGDGKATRALTALQSLDRYISATQLGITLASLGLGWVGEPALASFFEGLFHGLPAPLGGIAAHSIAVGIAFTVISTLHIILGELVPKALALLFPEDVSRWVTLPLMGFAWIMYIPITVLNGTANRLLRIFKINPPGEHERLHSPEEIRMLVEESGEGGSLRDGDARLLEGVFEFSEKTAEEVMTPRTEITALEADDTVEAAADILADTGRSRYPVYTDSLDEIVGVVHAKDILRAIRQRPGCTVRTILRQPLFVPGTREVEDVLADMKRLKTHLAVVLDEYGGTAGLVTMEDLLEEIVGEIYDEHDLDSETPERPGADGTEVLDGALPVTEFNDRFEETLDETDYTTLGGYLFGQIGRLPRAGDRIQTASHQLEVLTMAGRRVALVRVSPIPAPPAPGSAA